MLTILGSSNPCRAGVDRRTAMRIGALGTVGLSLPDVLMHAAQAGDGGGGASFGRAKRVLLLYLQGAASQYETWDPKPEAPAEIRGKWGAIPTSVPGVQICDQLPKLAQVAHRMALVRSMTHEFNNHSNLYTLSGYPAIDFTSETNPLDNRHHPFFGSVLDYLEEQRNPGRVPDMPRNIGLPFRFTTYGQLFRRAGPYGAFLGSGYDPVWTEFNGEATTKVKRVSFFDRLAHVEVSDPRTWGSRRRAGCACRRRPNCSPPSRWTGWTAGAASSSSSTMKAAAWNRRSPRAASIASRRWPTPS